MAQVLPQILFFCFPSHWETGVYDLGFGKLQLSVPGPELAAGVKCLSSDWKIWWSEFMCWGEQNLQFFKKIVTFKMLLKLTVYFPLHFLCWWSCCHLSSFR